jgi:3-dehydroquinate synthase
MNNFIVDNVSFNVETIKDNSVEIVSHPKNYTLVFESMPQLNQKDFLLIDKNIHNFYGISTKNTIVIDPSETIKNAYKSLEICDFLLENNFSKSDVLHVVGGGVIQDLGAFTSKIFKRGIDWIYYPTTLLSQCDSCIGGKTALNHNNFKNQIALFSSPSKVVLDLDFLSSLPAREINSGYGEVIKLFITGGEYFVDNYYEMSFKERIQNSLLIKKSVIEYDEFEFNIRKVLNYGHTFGHIIESVSNYEILHGEAVLLGIYIINKLFDNNRKINNFICENIDVSVIKSLDPTDIYHKISSDKKMLNNKIHFVNCKKPGVSVFLPTEVNQNLKDKICEIFTY